MKCFPLGADSADGNTVTPLTAAVAFEALSSGEHTDLAAGHGDPFE